MPTSNQAQKARVFRNGRSQAVRIPASYRFSTDEVYIHRDPQSGVISLSEKPFRSSIDDLFRRLDEAGAAAFTIERDLSLPEDREIL